MEYNKSKNLDV